MQVAPQKTTRSSSPLRYLWREGRPAIAASLIAALLLTIGWKLFAKRVEARTNDGYERAGEVRRIWGGPLDQSAPKVQWRRYDAATVGLASAELSKSDVRVDIDVEYRTRGVTEYPMYQATFMGTYVVKNPSADAAFVAFSIGLPSDRSTLMLSDLALIIDGKEDPGATEYAQDHIRWTGQMSGGQESSFELKYRARGLQVFKYGLFPSTQSNGNENGPIANTRLTMNVRGVTEPPDYPLGSMSPTTVVSDHDRHALVWDVKRVLTSFNAGVEISDRMGPHRAFLRLVQNAPFFFMMFALSLIYVFSSLSPLTRALHVLGLSAPYFVYFPLVVYLAGYVAWPAAVAFTALACVGMMVLHTKRFAGRRGAIRVAGSSVLFLIIPVGAYLVPAHAGLILVVAGFVAVAIGLRLTGMLAVWLEAKNAVPDSPVETANHGAGAS